MNLNIPPETSIQPELLSLQSKLVGEIERDEKTQDLIAKRVEKNRALLHAVNGSLGALVNEVTGGKFAGTVRVVIKSLPNQRFTPIEIEREITRQFPTIPLNKEGIRTTLWNLLKRGEIRQTRRGTNSVPAEYEKNEKISEPVRTRRRPTLTVLDEEVEQIFKNGR